MKTVEFLKEFGVQALKDKYSIVVKEYPEHGLLVLNYDQINSPKTADIVKECRGLILSTNFDVVSRSFDRFFNYGENGSGDGVDWAVMSVREKVDGSLIKVYHYDGEWHISTRGTAFAESDCNGFGKFRDLVLKSMYFDWDVATDHDVAFQRACNFWLDPDYTYIFEFASPENRVVTRYDGYNLYFLGSRHNALGVYGDVDEMRSAVAAFNCKVPAVYKFDSIEHCLEVVKSLPDLKEGYVVYNNEEQPVFKVKSPAYVACHLIRGEGLNPKRIMQLIFMNETDEYLTYYPGDEKFFTPYQDAYSTLIDVMDRTYSAIRDIEDQRDFAVAANMFSYSSCLFSARKNSSMPSEEFTKMREQYKMDFVKKFMEME